MHILIVTQYFWPENFRINDLALGMLERGHQVTVLTGTPNYPDGNFFDGYGYFNKQQDYQGVKVLRVPLIPRGNGWGLRLVLNYISFALTASVLGPLLCKGKFDQIFVFEPSPVTVGIPALILKKLKSAPVLFWVQDLWPESLSATDTIRSPFILKMVSRLVRFIYHGCDRILVTSPAYFSPIQALGVDSNKLYYFPQSVESLYKPMRIELVAHDFQPLPKGFKIMFAGNIGAAQSFDTILNAAVMLKEFSDIHWIIIGDGRMRAQVEEKIRMKELRETVHVIGRYPLDSMPIFFSQADVMLITLKKDPIFAYTVPGKMQSYLACGRPVIAALDGEGAKIINDSGAGFTCPAENSDALAQAVLEMYNTPKPDREKMGERGRRYYETNFDRDMLLDRLGKWMKDLADVRRV